MRRNNLMDDKVLRALTIGLTAMIAVTSTPMTVFADEVDGESENHSPSDESNVGSEDSEESQTDTESAYESAESTVKTVADICESINAIATSVDNITDAVINEDGVVEDIVTINTSFETTKDKKGTTEYKNETANLTMAQNANNSVELAEEALQETKDNLNKAVEAESTSKAKADESQKRVEAAAEAVDNAKLVSDNVLKIEKEYQEKANEIASRIEDAGSVEDARKLLDAAKQIGVDAEASYNEKLIEYNKAIDEYNAEKEAYAQAIEELRKAEQAYREAVGNNGAAKNIQEAIDNLTEARNNEMALKEAAQDAYEKMQNDAGILIMNAEKVAVDKRNTTNDDANWDSLDVLFDVIVRNYYIPETLGYGRDVVIEAKSVNADKHGIEKKNIGDLNYKTYTVKNKAGVKIAEYMLDYKMDESGKFRVDGENITKGLNIFIKDDVSADYVEYKDKSDGAKYVVLAKDFNMESGTYYDKKTGTGYYVQNYLDGKPEAKALKEVGTELRDFVNESKMTREALGDLSSNDGTVVQTISNLDAALEAATKLQETINKLQTNSLISGIDGIGDIGTLITELEAKIKEIDDKKENADKEIEEAKDILDEIIETIDDIEDVVDSLTPPADETPTGDTPAPAGETPFVAPILPISTPTFPSGPIALPDTGVAGVRRVVDGNVAETEQMLESAVKLKKIADDKDALNLKEISKLTRIEDEEVALAAIPGEVNKNMNWWWLLIVALLGATGYELYKKHEEKKQEAEANKN